MERDSFVFYRSFYEALKDLPEAYKAKMMDVICEYALNGKEVLDDPICKSLFTLIKPQVDANNKRYLNGKKGGRKKSGEDISGCRSTGSEQKDIMGCRHSSTKVKPSNNQNETKAEPNLNQVRTNIEPNVNDNVNDNVYVNECVNVNDNVVPFAHTPTQTEVEQYCKSNGLNNVDPERFWNHYQSNGWMTNGFPITDWKAKLRNWDKQDKKKLSQKRNHSQGFQERDYDFDKLEELYIQKINS